MFLLFSQRHQINNFIDVQLNFEIKGNLYEVGSILFGYQQVKPNDECEGSVLLYLYGGLA